jgi:DNA-binding CsgD family transcriptional regulator
LFSVPLAQCHAFWNVSAEIDAASTKDYALEFAREDVWMAAVRKVRSPITGRAFTDEELIDRRDFLRSRFYGEFLHQYGIGRLLTLMLREPLLPGAAPAATLSLYRNSSSEAFGANERKVLSGVSAHLVLAVETLWRLKALSINAGTLARTLDAVNAAVFLIDREGRLIFENEAGAQSRRRAEALVAKDGYLTPAAGVREQKRVVNLLREAREGRSARTQLSVGITGTQVLLCAAPISQSIEPIGGARSMLWLTAFARASAARRVAELFALSPAEQRLVGAICAGHSLERAAESFQSSVHTVRCQLKSIQRKTGWHTQAEIVRQAQQLAIVDAPN